MHHQHYEGLRGPCNLFLLGVGVHVDEKKGKTRGREKWLEVTLRAGKRTGCSCGQALEADGFELLRGALFYPWQARSSWWTQKGAPYGEYLITKASRQLP